MGFNVGAWMDARQGAGRVQSSAEASILRTQYVWNVYRHKGPKNASQMPEAASVPRFVFGNPRGIRGAKFQAKSASGALLAGDESYLFDSIFGLRCG